MALPGVHAQRHQPLQPTHRPDLQVRQPPGLAKIGLPVAVLPSALTCLQHHAPAATAAPITLRFLLLLLTRDDPTILAWEIANEPHTRDWFEQWPAQATPIGDRWPWLKIGKGQPSGRLVAQFLCEASALHT